MRRQVMQWHMDTRLGSAVTRKRSAPHAHPPVSSIWSLTAPIRLSSPGASLLAFLRNLGARLARLIQCDGHSLLLRFAVFLFGLDVVRDGVLRGSFLQRHDPLLLKEATTRRRDCHTNSQHAACHTR